jgi:hypothetical protein
MCSQVLKHIAHIYLEQHLDGYLRYPEPHIPTLGRDGSFWLGLSAQETALYQGCVLRTSSSHLLFPFVSAGQSRQEGDIQGSG